MAATAQYVEEEACLPCQKRVAMMDLGRLCIFRDINITEMVLEKGEGHSYEQSFWELFESIGL